MKGQNCSCLQKILVIFTSSNSSLIKHHDLNRNSHQGLLLFSISAKTHWNSMHFRPDFFKLIHWSFFWSRIDIEIQNTAQKQTIISTIRKPGYNWSGFIYTLYKIHFILKPGTFCMIFFSIIEKHPATYLLNEIRTCFLFVLGCWLQKQCLFCSSRS